MNIDVAAFFPDAMVIAFYALLTAVIIGLFVFVGWSAVQVM